MPEFVVTLAMFIPCCEGRGGEGDTVLRIVSIKGEVASQNHPIILNSKISLSYHEIQRKGDTATVAPTNQNTNQFLKRQVETSLFCRKGR